MWNGQRERGWGSEGRERERERDGFRKIEVIQVKGN
jgi:hypothetical protein